MLPTSLWLFGLALAAVAPWAVRIVSVAIDRHHRAFTVHTLTQDEQAESRPPKSADAS